MVALDWEAGVKHCGQLFLHTVLVMCLVFPADSEGTGFAMV